MLATALDKFGDGLGGDGAEVDSFSCMTGGQDNALFSGDRADDGFVVGAQRSRTCQLLH